MDDLGTHFKVKPGHMIP